MDFSNAIRQRIIMLVTEQNTKLSIVVKKAGLNYNTIMHFMDGKTKLPNLSTINQLSINGFGIPLKDFFNDAYFKNVITEEKREKTDNN